MATGIDTTQMKDMFVDNNPYQAYINNLNTLLKDPIPTAKNIEFQGELNKADALFRELINNSTATANARAISDKGIVNFLTQITKPGYVSANPEVDVQILETFKTESNRLKAKSAEHEQDYAKLRGFIDLLTTKENPSTEERTSFWSWAQERFWSSSVIAEKVI